MSRGVVAIACAIVLGAVLSASAWRVVVDDYSPISDFALIEVRTRAVGSAATPLTGAWSRFGWDHPGPLLFYVLALPYRLFGGEPVGIRVGALLVNAAAIGAVLLILRRHGRAALIIGTAGLLLIQLGLEPNHVRNEWNAAVPIFPFVLLLVAAWDTWDGPRWPMVLVPLVATFIMQTHVAYVILGLPAVLLWAVGVGRRRSERRTVVAALWAVGVAALLWIPPLVAVATDEPRNLRHLAGWLRSGDDATAGWRFAARLLGNVTALGFPFSPGLPVSFNQLDVTDLGVAPGFALVALVAVTLWLRRDAALVRLSLLLGATWLTAFVAVGRLAGPQIAHLTWWLIPLAITTWATIAWAVYRAVTRAAPGVAVPVGALAACLVVPLALVVARRNERPVRVETALASTVEQLGDATRRYLHGRKEVVLSRLGDYEEKGALQAGLMAYLDHEGITASVPSPALGGGDGAALYPPQFPTDRVRRDIRGVANLLVTDREGIARRPGRLVASVDPLDARERRDWLADYRRVRAVLEQQRRDGLVPRLTAPDVGLALLNGPPELGTVAGEIRRLQRLNQRGPAAYLWAIDSDDVIASPGG